MKDGGCHLKSYYMLREKDVLIATNGNGPRQFLFEQASRVVS